MDIVTRSDEIPPFNAMFSVSLTSVVTVRPPDAAVPVLVPVAKPSAPCADPTAAAQAGTNGK